MPELAEVHWFARRWNPALAARVTAVHAQPGTRVFRDCDTAALARELPGRKLEQILTSGKQAAFVFSNNAWLGVHLGMTGRLFVESSRSEQPVWAREEAGDAPTRAPDRKHDLLTLDFDNGVSAVFNDYRRFGKILFRTGPGEPDWWADRAPDILSPDFNDALLAGVLKKHARLALKPLLLDQAYFPGIGNWMADEVLWRAGISPHTRAGDLDASRREKLFDALREVCADALRVVGEGWGSPPDTWLFNHRWKKGGICPSTGKPLKYETLGGRTTCWSPTKQS
jgi:formamidopyrimidine-DNA glycosylase